MGLGSILSTPPSPHPNHCPPHSLQRFSLGSQPQSQPIPLDILALLRIQAAESEGGEGIMAPEKDPGRRQHGGQLVRVHAGVLRPALPLNIASSPTPINLQP